MSDENNSGQELENILNRLNDKVAHVRGHVVNVTVDVEDLSRALQEIDSLRNELKRQVY